MEPTAVLARLLAAQQGLILRSQAHACGLSDRAIAWRTTRGLWRRVFPGLYATFTGVPTAEQRMIAGSLYGGVGAQITGAAALRWYGLRYPPDDPRVHVLTRPGPRRVSRGFVVCARTTRLDAYPVRRGAFDICSLPRAAADAARAGYERREVRAFLAEVLQNRRVTVDQLDAEWRAGPVRGSKLLSDVLTELRDGVRSAPEAELRDVTRTSDLLPPILWNPVLIATDGTELPSPDGWIQDVGLALEVDSDDFHTSLDDLRRTRERVQRLAMYGILTVSFAPREIRREPRRVLTTIERTYAELPRGFRRAWGSARTDAGSPAPRRNRASGENT